MRRNKREHGRILSVETMQRGSALAADAAAAATSITVDDAGDFDEDGGWLYIGTQVVEFTACNDDTGVLTLATGLTALAEQGDPVHVYDPLYGEVVDYQVALVVLDGEHDNPDPVEAEVAEGVEDLPEGDRGKAGESCTLLRIGVDEWELIGVGGRPRKSRGIRFEADDTYVLTAGDITAASASIPLTHRPVVEGLTAVLASIPQRPTNYTINYDTRRLTMPLSGWEKSGDRVWVHYAYRKGVGTATIPPGYYDEVMADGPLLYWNLDEPVGTTGTNSVIDSSGNARHGTNALAPVFGQAALIGAGSAVLFDGSSRVTTSTSAFQVAEFTAEAWFKTTTASDDRIIGYGSTFSTHQWSLSVSVTGKPEVLKYHPAFTKITGTTTVTDGLPHHIVYVQTATTAYLYIDGTLEASTAVSQAMPGGGGAEEFFAGSRTGGAGSGLPGTEDEVAVYGSALSAARIAAHYAAGTP